MAEPTTGPMTGPMTGPGLLWPRLLDYWLITWRRTWRGSVFSSFLTPLLYVLAMGVLLGGFVKAGPGRLEGASSYLAFLAPGLVAGQAMTTVFGEMTWPVMSAVKWSRTYLAQLATPLRVRDVVVANLGYCVFRVALVSGVFVVVLVPFGVFASPLAALGVFAVQLLLGWAFAAAVYAIAVWTLSEAAYGLLFRLVMLPLFLFSGAFFPIANLDLPLRVLARITPLWQGVDLSRMISTGYVDGSRVAWHLLYLVAMAALGTWASVRALAWRMRR